MNKIDYLVGRYGYPKYPTTEAKQKFLEKQSAEYAELYKTFKFNLRTSLNLEEVHQITDVIYELTDVDFMQYRMSKSYVFTIAKVMFVQYLHKRGATSVDIARLLFMNHASVLHLINQHHNRYGYDKDYQNFWNKFSKIMKTKNEKWARIA